MRVLKWIGIGLAGLLVLVVGTVAVVALTFDWNRLRGFAADKASQALHRQVGIDGDLKVHFGNPIRIHIEGLRIANAPWSDVKDMADIQAIDLELRPWPLLHGDIQIPELKVAGPKVILEKNPDGAANWDFGGGTTSAATPNNRRQFPLIEHLAIENGDLRYRDPRKNVDFDSKVQTATGKAGGNEAVHLDGQGDFAGKPFTLKVEAGPLTQLRETSQPYPIRLDAAVGETKAHVEGTIAEPVKLEGVDLRLDFQGPDLAEIFPIVGFPTPPTRPYGLSGHLTHTDTTWTVEDLKGRLGDSDLNGTVSMNLGGERPTIRGELTSNRLAASDLSGFISGKKPEEKRDRVFSDSPIDLARLRTTDADIGFTGNDVEAGFLPTQALKTHIKLDNGLLTIDPLSLGMAAGKVEGPIALDARKDPPRLRTDLKISGMQLAKFFPDKKLAGEMGGTIGGQVQIDGQGNSVAALLGHSDGKLAFAVDGGKISNLIISALKTNVAEALGIALTGSKPLPFNCFIGDFGIASGVMRSRALVFDTNDTTVTGDARIDLGKEEIDATIAGRPKRTQIIATHVPVRVTGTFLHPSIAIETGETVARGVAALAMGALLTPFAAILPLIETGTDQPTACGRLIDQSRKPPPAPEAKDSQNRRGG